MIRFLAFALLILVPPLMADPQECLVEGAVEQIAEHMPENTIIYRECYHCQKPAYEMIRVTKTEIRPCHLRDLADERAVYITGEVLLRFQMPKCGAIESQAESKYKLNNELLVLNYAWLRDAKKYKAENIADTFGENSHHLCKVFSDKALVRKKVKQRKR
jgi:hypothetical protein